MTEIPYFDPDLPAESHACLSNLPGIQQLRGFINRLDGGQSGAQLWQVRFRQEGQTKDSMGILKLGCADDISQEFQKHRDASASLDHPPMPILLAEGSPSAGWQALIFSVAQGLIWRAQKLGDCIREARGLEALTQLREDLVRWYLHNTPQTCEGFGFIRLPHQPRLERDPDLFTVVADVLGCEIRAGQVLFEGENDSRALPNPLHVLFHMDAFLGKRFSAPFGPVHGDLHVGNVIVSREGPPVPMLIDFALFEAQGSIFHDLAFLEVSVALESVDLRLAEGRRLWESFFRAGWFAPCPEKLPTGLVGLWAQIEAIRQVALLVAGDDIGIQQEYKIAYLHAVASTALRWVQFDYVPREKRLGALYVAARALDALRSLEFIRLLQGLSKISWRELPPAIGVVEQQRLEQGRTWFRSGGKQALQQGQGVLIIGPALAAALVGYREADLARVSGINTADVGLADNDPAWADELAHGEDERKRQAVCQYLRDPPAKCELIKLLASIPWQAVLDWSQAPKVFHEFDRTLEGRRRVYRLLPREQAGERDRLGPLRTPWIAIRGAPDPPDCMVWGENWVDQLATWKRRLGDWSSQSIFPAVVVGVGLDIPMKEDIWGMVVDIFGGQASLVNVSHPVEKGRPSQRAALRHMVDLDLDPKDWLDLIQEFFVPPPSLVKEDTADRTVVFSLPESHRTEPDREEFKELLLEPEEAVRLHEYFEVSTEGTGRGAPPEGRTLGDLFRGYPVLWQEIREGLPVNRTCESDVIKSIWDDLRIGNPRRLRLYHEPGAGGSVLVRQIAWKLYRDARIPVVILRRFAATEVAECLRAFWYRLDRSFLVIVEEEVCLSEEWESIHTVLQQEQIPTVVLLVSTRSPDWIRRQLDALELEDLTGISRRFFLLDQLDDREVQDLHTQLELLLGPAITNRLQKVSSRSLFATLFTVFEGDFAAHRRIVHDLISDIPPEVARLLKTLAFFRLYGDSPWVPSELLARLAQVDGGIALPDALAGFRERIVLQRGEGAASVWAVSHSILAEDILAELLEEAKDD